MAAGAALAGCADGIGFAVNAPLAAVPIAGGAFSVVDVAPRVGGDFRVGDVAPRVDGGFNVVDVAAFVAALAAALIARTDVVDAVGVTLIARTELVEPMAAGFAGGATGTSGAAAVTTGGSMSKARISTSAGAETAGFAVGI